MLLDWFRKPHADFGTTYRIINLVAHPADRDHRAEPRRRLSAGRGLRLRRGVELLPEGARACWCCASTATTRNTRSRSTSASRGIEIPIGLGATTLVLFLVAIANLFSKQIATIYGVAFTVASVRGVHDLRAGQRAGRWRTRRRAWSSSISTCGRTSPRTPIARAARDASWWRCAISTACRTCEQRPAEDQPAPARHRRDDGATVSARRRRVRAADEPDLRRLREGAASRAW